MTQSSPVAISSWLKSATDELTKAGIDSARLDALLLLEDSLGKSRVYILSHDDDSLTKSQLQDLSTNLNRRLESEPMAYIRERVEFYGRIFTVNESVLIPRPETESFIDLVKYLKPGKSRVFDIGTGSGCIGITLKLELPELDVVLVENSLAALEVSKSNAKLLKADVRIKKQSLLDKTSDVPDIIVANLPYILDTYQFDPSTSYEPREALIGGPDGLDIYRELWNQIKTLGKKPSAVLVESFKFQHKDLEKMASASGYVLNKTDGLAQLFKLEV